MHDNPPSHTILWKSATQPGSKNAKPLALSRGPGHPRASGLFPKNVRVLHMLRAMRKANVFSVLVLGVFSCTVPNIEAPLSEPPLTEGCNPLGGLPQEDCLLPYPSDVFLRAGSQTGGSDAGHRHIAFPAHVLPASFKGVRLEPGLFENRDGFSPATPILAYFPTRLSAQNLPSLARPEDSLKHTSPVQLFVADTGQRVPLFAELDGNAQPTERQALIIHPLVRLRPKTRYIVALWDLKDQAGQPVAPLSGFAAILSGDVQPGSVRAALAARYKAMFSWLQTQGLATERLQLAWDFTTGDDQQLTGRLVAMRDRALADLVPTDPPTPKPPLVKIDRVDPMPKSPLLRQVVGTFSATTFLSVNPEGQPHRLALDGAGQPVAQGAFRFPLVVHIPRCAASARSPLPVMIYGHGLFGSALSEMDTSYHRELVERLCMVQVGTNWIGLSEDDKMLVAGEVMSDFNKLAVVTDRLQQAQINAAVLAKLVRSGVLGALPELQVGGRPVIDPERVFYYGISNGGIMGLSFLALSPDVQRGALCVPGGFFSLMLWRSSNFEKLLPLLAANYQDPLERQVLVALSQHLWDYTDPATYAPTILQGGLAGTRPSKRVLYQEGLGDAQVPNVATQKMVRTLGIPLLRTPVETPWGIPLATGPLPSAYVQFDIGQNPRPGENNVPPRDNPVHGAVRRLPAAQQQLQRFLQDGGVVVDACGGRPCVFSGL